MSNNTDILLSIVLADSAADSRVKTKTETFKRKNPDHDSSIEFIKPGGEKQIYLKRADDPIIDEFDNDNVQGYFFTKKDIYSYINSISIEYLYPQQDYINFKFLKKYLKELLKEIDNLDKLYIFKGKIKRDSGNRAYLQMPGRNINIYQKLVHFCLPLVTRYFFIKHNLESSKSIYIQIRPMLNYTAEQYANVLKHMANNTTNLLGVIHAFTFTYAESILATNVDASKIFYESGLDTNFKQSFLDSFETYKFLIENNISLNPSEVIEEIDFVEPSDYEGDISPIILYGPPGTGKTYKLQKFYQKKFDKRLSFFTTFHQSFSYEEFVEGLKPTLGDSDDVRYSIEQGVFYKACEKAARLAGYNNLNDAVLASEEDREEKFRKAVHDKNLVLLCIDEINRGNVASIFGDLISLIEPSKRLGNKDELILTLPYSKERFGVPSNLMIVGTMNTADRSIQLLDSALRRRFRFEELPPILDRIDYKPAQEVLRAINKRVRAILNKDAQIGHAYFIDVKNDEETLDVIAKKVIPLLEEYFYNDIDKIRFVLNDYGDKAQFYLEDLETKNAYEHYIEKADIDSEEKNFFYLNPQISGDESLSENHIPKETYSATDFIKQIIG